MLYNTVMSDQNDFNDISSTTTDSDMDYKSRIDDSFDKCFSSAYGFPFDDWVLTEINDYIGLNASITDINAESNQQNQSQNHNNNDNVSIKWNEFDSNSIELPFDSLESVLRSVEPNENALSLEAIAGSPQTPSLSSDSFDTTTDNTSDSTSNSNSSSNGVNSDATQTTRKRKCGRKSLRERGMTEEQIKARQLLQNAASQQRIRDRNKIAKTRKHFGNNTTNGYVLSSEQIHVFISALEIAKQNLQQTHYDYVDSREAQTNVQFVLMNLHNVLSN